MSRVKYGPASRARRRKISKMAKGQRGGRSKWHRITLESLKRAMAYATRDRRARKRDFRKLWILRISNACKKMGVPYSKFIMGLKKKGVVLNRKILADIAFNDENAFKMLVESVKNNSR